MPHAADEATEAAAPEATEAATIAPRRIAGTPTHGYEATREGGMGLISLNVRNRGQPGPYLLAVSFSQFDPVADLHFIENLCAARTAGPCCEVGYKTSKED